MSSDPENLNLSRASRPTTALGAAEERVLSCRRLAAGQAARYGLALAAALDDLSTVLYAAGRLDDALTAARESIAILRPYYERAFGPVSLAAPMESVANPLGVTPMAATQARPVQRRVAKGVKGEGAEGAGILADRRLWFDRDLILERLSRVRFTPFFGAYGMSWRKTFIVVSSLTAVGFRLAAPPAVYVAESFAVLRMQNRLESYPTLGHQEVSVRFLIAYIRPRRVGPNGMVSVIVRVCVSAREWPGVESTWLPDLGLSEDNARITIGISAPGLSLLTASSAKDVRVPPTGDSDSIVFELQARQPGSHQVRIRAVQGGSTVAVLTLDLSVTEDDPYEAALAQWPAPGHAANGHGGEATLEICRRKHHYEFQLSCPGQFRSGLVRGERLIGDAAQVAEQTIKKFCDLARGITNHTAEAAMGEMVDEGIRLWDEMVPREIQGCFWELRKSIRTLTIFAEDDGIPWELLYPMSEKGNQHGFLIEQFPVLRCRRGRSQPSITMSDPHYIIPPGSPSNAMAEVKAIGTILGDAQPERKVIDRIELLLDVIHSREMGLLHFVCHNKFVRDAGGSRINMADGVFAPLRLSRAAKATHLAYRRPLVFINACRSASEDPQYTVMMSWAQQFMKAGAGAFVGTLWEVRTESARTFAEEFYRLLKGGLSLGEATMRARLAIRDLDRADPTWLAYTVYGDPAARAIPPHAQPVSRE